MTKIRHVDRRMGLSLEFEAFARSVLACGCSGRQARDTILLTAVFLLPAALAVPLCDEMPLVRWFVTQREALGLEAAVYAFMAVGELFRCLVPYLSKLTTVPAPSGACDEVVQWGFDETTLDGTACFNQWCLLRTGTRVSACIFYFYIFYFLFSALFFNFDYAINSFGPFLVLTTFNLRLYGLHPICVCRVSARDCAFNCHG